MFFMKGMLIDMRQYGIKEISKKMDIPASTLRYYEKIGLLTDVARDEGGQRLYNDAHLDRLEGIKCFKDGGLTISKICEFYQYDGSLNEHIDDIIDLVTLHEKELSSQIVKMQRQLLHLQQKVRYYNGIKEAIIEEKEWPCFEDYA